MLVSYVSAEIPDRLVVVGADVAYAFSSVALDDYGDPGLIASLDDVVEINFKDVLAMLVNSFVSF